MVLIILLFIFSYLGLLVHGNVPVHYYVTVAPIITIIIAYILSKFKVNLFLLLILLIIFNLPFYLSDKWFYKKGNYNRQVEISKEILKDANGRQFNLKRVGDFDYYDDDYAQNYIYLMWMYGNEPVKTDQMLKYTIYEEFNNINFKKE